jgi:uncharacterized integral membrane protein (TIGR00698 family)
MLRVAGLGGWAKAVAPGLAATLVVALAATYLSEHYRAPVMIFALLIGMALNPISEDARYAPGIAFSARTLLRVSVALLGLRITFEQVGALGLSTLLMVVTVVPLVIGFGWLLARWLKLDARFGVLSGGSVAICGASAALAIATAWPRKDSERDTVVVIAGVATLSTAAMIGYPAIASALDLLDLQTGRFLGGSIHDVAQVVGAGYSVSQLAGDTATVVKLMRVAMLLPVVFLISFLVSRRLRETAADGKVTLVPWFLVAFVVLAAANGFGVVPEQAAEVLVEVSRWLLVVSVAALGMKTSARDIMKVGRAALIVMVAETVFMAAFVLGWIELWR